MQPTDALPILAYEKGFFKQEGLDVRFKSYPSGKRALKEGLLSNAVDVIASTEIPVVMALLENNALTILASAATADNVNRIIARSDRGIQSASDLAGKKIATQKASAVHYFLFLFLQNQPIDTGTVSLSFMKAELLPGALASGSIDAFSMREPYISYARELLDNKTITFEMPGLYVQAELLLSTRKFSREHPGVIRKLLKALVRAEAYAKENREDAIRTVATVLGIKPDIYASQWKVLDLRVRLDQSLLTLLESQSRWAIENRMTPAKEVPNFLDAIDMEDMMQVKPDAVTIIR
jgi:ABC-type nitrate/sulfonate/bicarbonate transport system substrate-binding protein